MQILPVEARFSRKGPEAWFTGEVWLDEIASPPLPARLRVVRVTFADGARTAWHTHPLGQSLHVLEGVCRIQLKGEPPRDMVVGDTAMIAPGEVHWHGAAPGGRTVHLAMQEQDAAGLDVVWGEKVTEREYSGH